MSNYFRQRVENEGRNKIIAEVIETSVAAADKASQSEEGWEIATDKDENRKITEKALKKLDEVNNFIEVNGSDHLNMIFNEFIENMEQMKLKN